MDSASENASEPFDLPALKAKSECWSTARAFERPFLRHQECLGGEDGRDEDARPPHTRELQVEVVPADHQVISPQKSPENPLKSYQKRRKRHRNVPKKLANRRVLGCFRVCRPHRLEDRADDLLLGILPVDHLRPQAVQRCDLEAKHQDIIQKAFIYVPRSYFTPILEGKRDIFIQNRCM